MVVSARLAEESVTRYGDNGLPQEAAEVLAAAKKAGPLPFESPGAFRGRMRDVSRWMKENGLYPGINGRNARPQRHAEIAENER